MDRKHLSPVKLYDLSRKYVELRGYNDLCLTKPHLHQDHLHVHFCFSGILYQSEKSLLLTMKQFYQVREELEKYQIKEHPELSHSLVYLDKSKALQANRKVITSDPLTIPRLIADSKEVEKNPISTRHTNKPVPTIKTDTPIKQEKRPISHEEIIYLVQQAFEESRGLTDFIDKLKSKDLQPFARNGRPYGIVISHGKYSFDEIQISKEHLQTLERFDEIRQIPQELSLFRSSNIKK